ncbi:hypothetical protein CV770_03970 [Bradyrhizobium sp. AC87j1]|nr:hypothetical protein CV770_03970 [Bradyrhizobium sp. AC87j1]
MPRQCNGFSHSTLQWDRLFRFLTGALGVLDAADRAALVPMVGAAAGDEGKRLRKEREILRAALPAERGRLTARARADELHLRLKRYAGGPYARDRKSGTPSSGNFQAFLILEANDGEAPTSEVIRQILKSSQAT